MSFLDLSGLFWAAVSVGLCLWCDLEQYFWAKWTAVAQISSFRSVMSSLECLSAVQRWSMAAGMWIFGDCVAVWCSDVGIINAEGMRAQMDEDVSATGFKSG